MAAAGGGRQVRWNCKSLCFQCASACALPCFALPCFALCVPVFLLLLFKHYNELPLRTHFQHNRWANQETQNEVLPLVQASLANPAM